MLEHAKPVHARWSDVNREYLEFVERNPAFLRRDAFASIYRERSLASLSIQPWPLFVGAAQRTELQSLALGMDRLVKSVPERFLGNDPARIAGFYRKNEVAAGGFDLGEDLIAFLMEEPNGVAAAPSRGDYIETARGLHLLEFNAGNCLGGLHAGVVGELYLESEPTARFLRERGLRARSPGVMRAFFRHVVEDTLRLEVWDGGALNVAMAILPQNPGMVARHRVDAYTRDLRAVLAEHGIPDGEVLLCAVQELAAERGVVTVHGRPVHAVIEQHDGEADASHLFRAFKAGMIDLFSGPIGELLSDKRNLALLSEHAESAELTPGERELVQRHLPWTRRIAPATTTFRGAPFRIPQDLAARRAAFVLKKASSVGGDFVVVGRYRSGDEWTAALARALREEDWIAQEYLETVPYGFQTGESDVARHELVWGLFAFGRHYGGAFLRMHPAGEHGGVVNTRRGSEVGAALELEE